MKNKKSPSEYLKPHLNGLTQEEIHLVQKGFRLGLEWAKEEIDHFIKVKDVPVN